MRNWTRWVIGGAFLIYFGSVAVKAVTIKRNTGANPLGQTGGERGATRLNMLASLLIWITGILHPLVPKSVDWFGRITILEHPWARVMGAIACAKACLLLIWGEISLGKSFRIALPDSKQPLVTQGIYRWIRNPLALSIDLLTLGFLLLAPSVLSLLTFILTVVSYEWKIRIEEAYLRETHGVAYAEYCLWTGRYFPKI